jgi:nanoRNase/pAp phosphatase (c-di-AMP/oligoRNAs hydrolase)
MPENTSQPKPAVPKESNSNRITQVAEKIKDSENVLVALSKNPSVDELSAALGLTFILDKLGKHATAIFSGAVPNAIEFLEPEKTFESNTNSLQDFIIALDKEKADHLRYKVEGDFVKVFITPYKTTLDESDLEFSHGDFNVDLIISINVSSVNDLDSALAEYGKIKHDASSINISADKPGSFADLEWGNPKASSVSEMIAQLADILDDGSTEDKLVEKSTATALLAGIVAATNRFSNEHTSAETMSIASELMTEGADQQLISSSIPVDILTKGTVDINDEVEEVVKEVEEKPEPEPEPVKEDPTELDIRREEKVIEPVPTEETEEEKTVAKKPDNVPDLPAPEPSPVEPEDETPTAPEQAPEIESTAVPAPAEAAPVETPTPELEPLAAPMAPAEPALPREELPPIEAPVAPETTPMAPENAIPVVPTEVSNAQLPEPVAQPPVAEFQPAPTTDPAQPPVPPVNAEYVAPPLPMPGDGTILPPPPIPFDLDGAPLPPTAQPVPQAQPMPVAQPAPVAEVPVAAAPATAQDFAQGVQDDMQQNIPSEPIMPAILQEPDEPSLAPNPGTNQVMQDQVYGDPGAFKIPGM